MYDVDLYINIKAFKLAGPEFHFHLCLQHRVRITVAFITLTYAQKYPWGKVLLHLVSPPPDMDK